MLTTTLTAGDGRTLHGLLAWHATYAPRRTFLAFEPEPGCVRTTSYGEFYLRARQVAGLLRDAGVRPGDRVNVHLTNQPEFYESWFGTALAGAVLVPTNPLASADELGFVLRHANCRAVITERSLHGVVAEAAAGTPVLVVGSGGADDFDACVRASSPHAVEDTTSEQTASVLYTSGTTSRPKGVLVSHAAYAAAGETVAGQLRLGPDDRQLVVLPLFHGNAQYYSTMSALVTGASIGLAPKFSASRWSAQAAALEATVTSLFAAPMRMILAAEQSEHDRGHRLRAGMFAQNVSEAALREFEGRFGVPMVQLYGMTETVTPPTMGPLHGDRRPHSIGRPVPGAVLRIVDAAGEDVEPGEAGELLVGGEPGRTLMTGYLDDPDSTAKALRDGWLHTGDTVRADRDGYLHFVDRAKDVIKRSGENVASAEVERVLNEHPAVFESAVVAVPDPTRDEAVKAFAVLQAGAEATAEDLRQWCAQRLAKFKVPEFVQFVDRLPRTSVGKIQKHLLRNEFSGNSPGR
ncbi:AMP-binding protein [Saccharopolyspora shandongensis]|uniref:class I adenylate-forming enzyme family protein n=1 Tax=Saccharopolyspora shandongensis TaxID=418495 RepID=UPI003449D790